eukprot:SAG11_NODE_2136_length_3766_cov_6.499864_1_plen_135_part_00
MLRRLSDHLRLLSSPPRAPPAADSSALAIVPSSSDGIDVGIITEATGEHLDGFLGGFALADDVRAISTADISGGAQFETVRTSLPTARTGSMHTTTDEMLRRARPTLTLVTAEAHRTPTLVRAALQVHLRRTAT